MVYAFVYVFGKEDKRIDKRKNEKNIIDRY